MYMYFINEPRLLFYLLFLINTHVFPAKSGCSLFDILNRAFDDDFAPVTFIVLLHSHSFLTQTEV